MKRFRRSVLAVTALTALSTLQACGGGDAGFVEMPAGGGGGAAGEVGVFKDSSVAGLNYSVGNRSFVTEPDGTFRFQGGSAITFKVGGLTLGTANGSAVITPLDLVAGGSSSSAAVLNITRLLMMADADNNPQNGILISANLQARAGNWSPVNFADAGFDASLQTLAADARSADGGIHPIATAADARTHLESTFRCVTSGAFRGTFSGAEQGRFGGIIIPTTGELLGLGVLTGQVGSFGFTPISSITIDQQRSVASRADGLDATFTGRVQWPDLLSGNWTKTGSNGGTFTGTRLAARQDAVYRYAGLFNDPATAETGIVSFDVNVAGQVTGVAWGSQREQLIDFSGTLLNGVLLATSPTGVSINATDHPITPAALEGTWKGTGLSGEFIAWGCKLN